MSLLTRCPACTTLYKVVPDQLRISQGWVKCGQCGEVFDATQHLIEAYTEPEEPLAGPSAETTNADAEDAADSAPLPPVDTQQTIEQQHDEHRDAEPATEPIQTTDENAIASSSDSELPVSDAPVDHDIDAAQTQDSDASVFNSTAPESSDLISETESTSLLDPQEPEPLDSIPQEAAATPSFMNDAKPRFDESVRWMSRIWWIACAVLIVSLGSQWIYQDHDRLAASRPQWRPALSSICNVLQCSIAPLQQIESIAIDSAAFSKGDPGRYRLSFTLKNTANLILAMPNIELTLTDVQDRVVLRRVITPQELLAAEDYLSANSEWPVTVNLRIQSEPSSPAVIGYRLLAFYP